MTEQPELSAHDQWLARAEDRLGQVWLWLLFAFALLTHPFALWGGIVGLVLPAGAQSRVPMPFEWDLPGAFVLGILAVPLLVAATARPNRWLTGLALAGVGSLGLAFLLAPQHPVAFVASLGHWTIPLAAGLLTVRGKLKIQSWNRGLAILWAVNIFVTVVQVTRLEMREAVGVGANRNWQATYLLATAPGAWAAAAELLKRFLPKPKLALVLASLLVGVPTLHFVYLCDSRGAWLAVVVLLVLLAIDRLPRLRDRAIALTLVAVAGVTLFVVLANVKTDYLIRRVSEDVRLPMWGSAAALIADHPLGVGPGRFRRVYTPYRANSRYHRRLVAASISIHPHNEVLYRAAEEGWVGGLAFLGLLLILLRRPDPQQEPLACAAKLPAVLLCTHAMLDMNLVRAPGELVALAALGACWGPCWHPWPGPGPKSVPGRLRRTALSLVLLAAVLLSIWHLHESTRSHLAVREALIAERLESRQDPAAFVRAWEIYRAESQRHPNRVEPAYEAARLAMTKLGRFDDARQDIAKVREIDPDFAHTNAYVTQLRLWDGDPEGALQAVRREVQLYPGDPISLQLQYNCLAFTARYGELAEGWRALANVIAVRAELRHPPGRRAELRQQWLDAVIANRGDEGVALAGTVIRGDQVSGQVSPLFLLLEQRLETRVSSLAGRFTDLDFSWWRLQMVIAADLNRLRDQQDQPAAQLPPEPIADFVRERVTLADRGFLPPLHVYATRRGNAWARACLLSCFLDQAGYATWLQPDERGRLAAIYILGGRQAWRCGPDLGELTAITRREAGTALFRQGAPWPRYYVPLADFFQANALLAGVLVRDDPKLNFLRQRPPLMRLRLAFLAAGFHPPEPFPALEPFLVADEARAVARRLRGQLPPVGPEWQALLQEPQGTDSGPREGPPPASDSDVTDWPGNAPAIPSPEPPE